VWSRDGPRILLLAGIRVVSYGMAFTVRTDDQLEEALTALAAAEGISRQEIIRRAVLERYERAGHSERVARSTGSMIERWGDVLERLGTE
jgi:predicted transcriptional regulator